MLNLKINSLNRFIRLAFLAPLVCVPTALAGEFSPYVDVDYPRNVLWGDTHVHSSYSGDAGMIGNRLGPDEAFRFARGETVTSSSGIKVKLIRPLDFLVLADHSENMGLAPMLAEGNPGLLANPIGKKLHELISSGRADEAFRTMIRAVSAAKGDQITTPELMSDIWQRVIRIADRYYQPGVFTPLLGYEWTAMPGANNIHRVVVFRDGVEKVKQVIPFSSYDSSNPENLWRWMSDYESRLGGQVLAIPHNGNTSNGTMFAVENAEGKAIDADYARRRARWEPLVEVTQMKGDSESHPLLSPDDEFADFETWDNGNMGFAVKIPEMLPHEYARSALKIGMEQERKLGENPFKFGMIGSTDTHTSLATTREENFMGKASVVEPSAKPRRFNEAILKPLAPQVPSEITTYHWQVSASGMAAVWARENTREAIFDAMRRKEVYATTGSRITVRFFGGWGYEKSILSYPNYIDQAYAEGVPMGGDLSDSASDAPRFLLAASKDPDGANLDRIQIIKGWVDQAGKSHERVYNVAVSDKARWRQDGTVTAVGNTVDEDTARFLNTIGSAQLSAWWKDPDFDPQQRAFYYARVLEIPTPRWTTYDAVRFAVERPQAAPVSIQDRAYTSPIWYQPKLH